MKITKKRALAVVAMLLAVLNVFALDLKVEAHAEDEQAAANAPLITGINVVDNAIEIKGSAPFEYTMYKPSDPFRYIVEIRNAGVGTFKNPIRPTNSFFTEIVPSETDTPKKAARLEILMQSPSELEPLYINGILTLKAKGADGGHPNMPAHEAAGSAAGKNENRENTDAEAEKGVKEQAASAAAEPVKADEAASSAKATEINGIRFEEEKGVVKFIISGNGALNPSVFTLKNRIVLDIPDAAMKADVPSTVILPVKSVRAGRYRHKTRLVVDTQETKNFDIESTENAVILRFKTPVQQQPAISEAVQAPETANEAKKAGEAQEPSEAKELPSLAEGAYTGKKISLDFQDSDIVPIFRLLADISGYNVVVNPDVKGKITMKLINVPWDQALDIVLKTFSLDRKVEGNIIRIAPLSVFAKENEERAKAIESEVKAEPMQTRIFPVSYADVSMVEAAIKNSKSLTPRGNLSTDKRTSSIIVKDVPSVFPSIENLLATLDKPIPQVMIEARIVEVMSTNTKDLGVQWGLKLNTTDTLLSAGGYSGLNKGSFTGNNLIVDFPSGSVSTGAGSGFSFGILNPAKTLGLDLQLSAIEKINRGRVISNPRIVTTDNEKALILQGTSEPYPVKDPQSGQISTGFKDVVLSTEVTPHITPAGSISMSVLVKKEDILGTVNISGSQVPRTSKIEGNTKVLVKDGETLVIGGVYKKAEKDSVSGLPGIMNLPVIGSLFKNKTNSDETTEILIFITPRIMEKP